MAEILLIEDSPEISMIIARSLEPENSVKICATLEEARRETTKRSFDLLILDLGLPDGDGIDFLSDLRNSDLAAIPVMIVTGRSGVSEQVLGYSLGADDYITKPFQPLVFQAKVRAKLRGLQAARKESENLSRGDIRVDLDRQKVRVEDRDIQLTSTEYKILVYMMRHADHVISRDQLISAVWGENTHVIDRTTDTHISHLRTKLQSSRCTFKPVHGTGYRFTFR
jgi:DNA-binding response OmpR family regulator